MSEQKATYDVHDEVFESERTPGQADFKPGPIQVRTASLPAKASPENLLMMAIERGASMEQIEKLIELKERWEAAEARKAFEAAMSAARAEIKPIIKTAEVDFTSQKGRTHYKHETLDGIAHQVDPILGKYGLSYRYRSRQESGMLHITCIIAHRDGHAEETTLAGPPDTSGNKNAYQAVGSAATYLQRQTLKLALGLSAAKDDDAQSAAHRPEERPAPATINREQAKQLVDLAIKAGEDAGYILKVAKINGLSELPVSRFQGAVKHLNELAAKKEAAAETLADYEAVPATEAIEDIFGQQPTE